MTKSLLVSCVFLSSFVFEQSFAIKKGRSLTNSGVVLCLDTSPKGHFLASGGKDGVVNLWDYKTGKIVDRFEGHSDPVWALAFDQTGQTVASASVTNDWK